MGIRVTMLSENNASMGDYIGEWGLSILIESDEGNVLLDAGKGSSCVYNADTLGIDLRCVSKIVLSHGHFDHTGGLHDVLRRMRRKIEIIAHPDVWQAKFSLRKGEQGKYIGIPFSRAELENLGAEFVPSKGPVQISRSMVTTGEIPLVTEFEAVDSALFVRDEGGLRPDPVMDDQALIVKTARGLVVLLGCAHRGLVNTLLHAMSLTGEARILAVIGGSHLLDAQQEQILQTVAALREFGVRMMGLCHCTDLRAMSFLSQQFGDEFIFCKAGSIVEFD